MKKRVLLLTGSPGIGKTTILLKIIEALRAKRYDVGGMVSREVRLHGNRVGFEISDLNSNRRGWLAHVAHENGPRIGKYHVNIDDLNSIGAEAVKKAIEDSDVVAIDEIGPMELCSGKFGDAVEKAVESSRLVIGIVHWKAKSKLIDGVKKRQDADIFVITHENRESLDKEIVKKAIEFLSEPATQ